MSIEEDSVWSVFYDVRRAASKFLDLASELEGNDSTTRELRSINKELAEVFNGIAYRLYAIAIKNPMKRTTKEARGESGKRRRAPAKRAKRPRRADRGA